MKNKLNLPEAFVNYAASDKHEQIDNRYSVTELLKSTQEIYLSRNYEIEEDVSEIIPALFGSAVHHILESNTKATETLLPEYSIEAVIGNDIIVGRIDLLNLNDLTIEDYKTCSVSKIQKQDFSDWKLQGLLYAYLIYLTKNIKIKQFKFYALMKDWSKIKSATAAFYPTNPIFTYIYNIGDSDLMYIEDWLNKKLKDIHEGNLYCSDEDRWFTGNKYAVYKSSKDKRAYKVCDTENEAHDVISNELDGAGIIEVRKGEYLKCKYYCKYCKECKLND